jgi:Ca2+-binding EF-hand superfamily protein
MTGFIGVGQLRYILTNLGEKMSDDEVDELLKAVDTGSGEVNYTGMFVYSFDDTSEDGLRYDWDGTGMRMKG